MQKTGAMPGNGPREALHLREAAWFYVVPLSALSSFAQLRRLVVQLPLDLLAGNLVDAAFAKAPEVLRFSRRKGELLLRS